MSSAFDDNFASSGASVSFNYYSGSFNNVIFSNHTGPVLRVRINIFIKYVELVILTYKISFDNA